MKEKMKLVRVNNHARDPGCVIAVFASQKNLFDSTQMTLTKDQAKDLTVGKNYFFNVSVEVDPDEVLSQDAGAD